MSALFILLAQAAAAPPMPPADWSAMPELPVAARPGFDPSAYVRREVAAGRCRAAPAGSVMAVTAPVAVLVDAAGAVQRVVPRAIECPTVEQFTAGYVSSLARRTAGLKPGWYRYAVTYRWRG